jgi:hypothetical protein
MKTPQKIKATVKNKSHRAKKTSYSKVAVSTALPVLHLIGHKHTGKLMHHRHTSHLLLVILLLIVGLFLYASASITNAAQQTASGSVSVGVTVPGPAPTIGATITAPSNGTVYIDQDMIEVSGTCVAGSFVIVYSDGVIAGSAMCTSAGVFVITVQLSLGEHSLTAKNFDNLNQPGPDTDAVNVTMTQSGVQTVTPPAPSQPVIGLPTNPSIIPGVAEPTPITSDGCATYSGVIPTSSTPRIAVVCIPRLVDPNVDYTVGVLVWGGSAPYALNIDWGDGSQNTLRSLSAAGYYTFGFRYASPGVDTLKFRLTDSVDKTSYVQTAVRVNGVPQTFFGGISQTIMETSWFETPVPLYLLAVAITLGFWAGDIFDRRVHMTKRPHQRHRAV